MHFLGYDIGSSSIKACLLDGDSGEVVASAASPQQELAINSPQKGWAEQDPRVWWSHVKKVTAAVSQAEGFDPNAIASIGITYQMHGLVMVDEQQQVLHPAIIWCDGRAVDIGEKAFEALGAEFCLEHYLNSPGNFTASKLKWVREHKPDIYAQIDKIMLPGDYIAMKLSGAVTTSISGLSEGIFWDYQTQDLASDLLDYYGISPELLPDYHPNFSVSGELTAEAADELGLKAGIPIGYRSGDQPNNALSLNVMEPGEIAATAGTSGVIYGVTDEPLYDQQSRVNTFIHVSHDERKTRYGVLLCINGTGIQNAWLKSRLLGDQYSYNAMNRQAAEIPIGSEGVRVLPFGNGPERVLQNNDVGAQLRGIKFNHHTKAHVMRAVQEGICFSLNYGLKVMKQMGLSGQTIRVGSNNMFMSPVFREAFTNITGATVELYDTSGALGAAIGAGLGTNHFKSREQAFKSLNKIDTLQPDERKKLAYQRAYEEWEAILLKELEK